MAWESPREVAFAGGRAGGPIGQPQAVPGSREGYDPAVVMDRRGRALIVWRYHDGTGPKESDNPAVDPCCFGLRATFRRRDGSFSRVKTLSPVGQNMTLEALAFGPRGRAAVMLRSLEPAEDRPFLRYGSLRDVFEARRRLPIAEEEVFFGEPLSIVLTRRWPAIVYSAGGEIRERRAGDGWRKARALAQGVEHGPVLDIATGASGHQVALWTASIPTDIEHYRIIVGERKPRQRRFKTYFVSTIPVGGEREGFVSVAPSGAAVVGWVHPDGRAADTLLREPTGGFRSAGTVRGTPTEPGLAPPTATVGNRGHSALVWGASDPTPNHLPRERFLEGAFAAPGGQFGGAEPSGSRVGLYDQPRVFVDRDGRGTVVWSDGTAVRARARSVP